MAVTRFGLQKYGTVRFWQHGAVAGASTYEDFFDGPNWGISFEGTTQTGNGGQAVKTVTLPPQGDPTARPEVITLTPNEALWTIETRNSGGAKLSTVTEWYSGKLREKLDEASSLEFTVLGDNAVISEFAPPNTVWLRDRWGLVIDKFRLTHPLRVRSGVTFEYRFRGQSLIRQLAKEPVQSYYTGDEPIPVSEIVNALMANQVQSPKIAVGDIDSNIAYETLVFSAEETNVLAALVRLQSMLASRGHIYLDAKSRLCWTQHMGTRGELIEVGAQLKNAEVEYDYEDLVTRLYLYGAGQDPRTRLSLAENEGDDPYMERNTETYGVVPLIKIDNRVKHYPSLVAMANKILERYSEPVTRLSVNILELAKADTQTVDDSRFNAEFLDLYKGSQYTVIDADQGINTTVDVVEIEHDLENPFNTRAELSNRSVKLSDYLRNIIEQMNPALDVNDDGSRYPEIGRLFNAGTDYSGYSDLAFRNGDWRHTPDGMQYYQGGAWNDVEADLTFGVDSDIQNVGDANAAGNTNKVADAGHVHAAVWLEYTGA